MELQIFTNAARRYMNDHLKYYSLPGVDALFVDATKQTYSDPLKQRLTSLLNDIWFILSLKGCLQEIFKQLLPYTRRCNWFALQSDVQPCGQTVSYLSNLNPWLLCLLFLGQSSIQ